MPSEDYTHMNDDKLPPPLDVTFGDVTDKNVRQLQILNSVIFPVKYSDQFYKEAVNAPPGFVKLAFFNEIAVGAVCCRKERYVANHAQFHKKQSEGHTGSTTSRDSKSSATDANEISTASANGVSNSNSNSDSSSNSHTTSSDSSKSSIYILTLGVLAPYRERGIGKQLVTHVLDLVKSSPHCKDAVDVYVHVQDGNDDALRFYDRYGFQVTEKLVGYYKRIQPADCLIVRKSVNIT